MEDQLKDLIVDRLFLEIEPADIQTNTPLAEYGVDSFLLLELVVAIEELFDIRFKPDDINADTLRSIATLKACIKAKQAEASDDGDDEDEEDDDTDDFDEDDEDEDDDYDDDDGDDDDDDDDN